MEKKGGAFYSETVVLNFEKVGQKLFTLTCPFIPDKVEVQAAVGNTSSGNVLIGPTFATPFYPDQKNHPTFTVEPYNASNMFLIELSCIPAGHALPCNLTNTFNPVFFFSNTNQHYFQGNYSADAYNSRDKQYRINGGQVILYFNYVKY
jgi:hypothetical protein